MNDKTPADSIGGKTTEDNSKTLPANVDNFEFELNDDGNSYKIKSVKDKSIERIPSKYRGLPVTVIDSHAFSGCTGLKDLFIPARVESIGFNPFAGCSGLETIIVDKNNKNYHSSGNCLIDTENKLLVSGCKNSVIPNDGSVTKIGKFAFFMCKGLKEMEIPASVTEIGDKAFEYCTKLSKIGISSNVTQIGNYAFDGCKELKEIEVHSCITRMGIYALSGIGIKEIFFSASINSIGRNPVIHCSNLETIIVDKNNKNFHSYGCCLIETATKKIISGCKNSVIPKDGSVTVIGESAFNGCADLTEIDIPSNITLIEDNAFNSCKNLKSIKYGGTKAQWDNIEKGRYYDISVENCVVHCADGDIKL